MRIKDLIYLKVSAGGCNAVGTVELLVLLWEDRKTQAYHVEPFVALIARDPVLTSTEMALEANVFVAAVVIGTQASLILRHLKVWNALIVFGSLLYRCLGETLLLVSSLTKVKNCKII